MDRGAYSPRALISDEVRQNTERSGADAGGDASGIQLNFTHVRTRAASDAAVGDHSISISAILRFGSAQALDSGVSTGPEEGAALTAQCFGPARHWDRRMAVEHRRRCSSCPGMPIGGPSRSSSGTSHPLSGYPH